VFKKEAQKIIKYKDPYNRNTARVECKNKSDIRNNGATGTISKSFRKYARNITDEHESRNYRQQPYWARYTYFEKY
jgi:hypothetical protein